MNKAVHYRNEAEKPHVIDTNSYCTVYMYSIHVGLSEFLP